MPADSSGIFLSLTSVFGARNGNDMLIFGDEPVERYLGDRLFVGLGDFFQDDEQGLQFLAPGGAGAREQASHRWPRSSGVAKRIEAGTNDLDQSATEGT